MTNPPFPPSNSPISDSPLLRSSRFTTRTEFHEEIYAAIASAQREICLADPVFTHWPFNQPKIEAALENFFLASRANRMRVLTHPSDRLAADMPRFMRLLRRYAHALICKQVAEQGTQRFVAEWSFIIVDRTRIVRRFHQSSMQGNASLNPADTSVWLENFDKLWDESEPGLSATTLGLAG